MFISRDFKFRYLSRVGSIIGMFYYPKERYVNIKPILLSNYRTENCKFPLQIQFCHHVSYAKQDKFILTLYVCIYHII